MNRRLQHSAQCLAVLCCLAGLLLGAVGCKCSGTDIIAKLTNSTGEVSRDKQASVGQWTAAKLGAEFSIGDGVKTANNSTGVVEFDDGAKLKLEQATTVRFLETAPGTGERGVDVLTGDAVLEVGKQDLRLRTGIGLAVLESGSLIRLSRTDRGLRFEVTVGLAQLGEDKTPVRAGESVEVGIGMAILEKEEPPPPAEETTAQAPIPEELPDEIAVTVEGGGALYKAPGEKVFKPLAAGDHSLKPGAQLKLKANNNAKLTLGRQTAELGGPGTYLITSDPEHFVQPVAGVTLLRADGRDMSLDVPGGKVVALGSQGPAMGEVTVRGKQVDVFAKVGKLAVELNGQRETISAGERAKGGKSGLSVSGRGIGFFDLSVGAGGSILVHDPAPPTAVRIDFSKQCDNVGIVERLKGRTVAASAAGKGGASLKFPAGRNTYRLRCLSADGKLSKPKSRGHIAVYRDPGTAALAKTPPATSVNVDGRSYTILYQNRLPAVSVRWPNAPKASSYKLSVSSKGRSFTVNSSKPSYSFPAGKLSEGKHTFQFRGSNGRKSRATTATIRFDNAAPKASIKSPGNGSFGGGAGVTAAGVALPGWKVFVGGKALAMDRQQRFSQSVTAGQRGLVLRFEHPSRGTHYYLRRASGVQR